MIHRGDIVGVRGFVGKSLKGELSIYALELQILTPCLKFIPKLHFGMSDVETRIKKRYLDMIANPNVVNTFRTRSMVFKLIRQFLDEKDFVEMQTPIITSQFGGATANHLLQS